MTQYMQICFAIREFCYQLAKDCLSENAKQDIQRLCLDSSPRVQILRYLSRWWHLVWDYIQKPNSNALSAKNQLIAQLDNLCCCPLGLCIDCLVGGGDLLQGGGRLYQPLWRSEMGDLTHFFCKSHKLHISRWRILFLPSCIWCILPSNTCILRTSHEFPKMRVTISNPHFRKFVRGPQNTCI